MRFFVSRTWYSIQLSSDDVFHTFCLSSTVKCLSFQSVFIQNVKIFFLDFFYGKRKLWMKHRLWTPFSSIFFSKSIFLRNLLNYGKKKFFAPFFDVYYAKGRSLWDGCTHYEQIKFHFPSSSWKKMKKKKMFGLFVVTFNPERHYSTRRCCTLSLLNYLILKKKRIEKKKKTAPSTRLFCSFALHIYTFMNRKQWISLPFPFTEPNLYRSRTQ